MAAGDEACRIFHTDSHAELSMHARPVGDETRRLDGHIRLFPGMSNKKHPGPMAGV